MREGRTADEQEVRAPGRHRRGSTLAPFVTSSIAHAEKVTICTRHWYCAWLCQTCTTKTQGCHDFSSIHTICRVFVEILHG